MNHLAHFALTDGKPLVVVGSFLGDHVKGRVDKQYDGDLAKGIRLHRAIDSFTDSHTVVSRSLGRFDPPFRRYAGILTDIAFDYFLANQWQEYYSTRLEEFSRHTLSLLVTHRDLLPDSVGQSARRMYEHNAMAGYVSEQFVEQSFKHISTRLSRENPLAFAFEEFVKLRIPLQQDFAEFYPDLMNYCDQWLKDR